MSGGRSYRQGQDAGINREIIRRHHSPTQRGKTSCHAHRMQVNTAGYAGDGRAAWDWNRTLRCTWGTLSLC